MIYTYNCIYSHIAFSPIYVTRFIHVVGTLNPALQDRFGRPKRDISTIIHILNDLLCATPQYRRHARQGHTITLEASSGNPPKSGSSGGSSLVSVDSRTAQNIDFMGESYPTCSLVLDTCCSVVVTCGANRNTL